MIELRVADFVRAGISAHDGLRALSAAANAAGADVRIIFPERARYVVTERASGYSWALWPLFFDGIEGLTIEGNGATIEQAGGYTLQSTGFPFGGLRLHRCDDVLVRDLELRGGADSITRDPLMTEPDSHGLSVSGGNRIAIEDVALTNWCGDGVLLTYGNPGGGVLPLEMARDVVLRDVHVRGAGRNGLSVTEARDVLAEDCSFRDTGRHLYGSHSPAAGVCIENGRHPGDAGTDPPWPLGERQGAVTFRRCHIENNTGRTFVAQNEQQCDITLDDCDVIGNLGGVPQFETDFGSPGMTVRGCRIRTAGLRMSHNTGQAQDAERRAVYVDNEIEILAGGLHSEVGGERIAWRNRLVTYGAGGVVFACPGADISGSIFRDRRGFVPSSPFLSSFSGAVGANVHDIAFEHNVGESIWVRIEGGSPMPVRALRDEHVLYEVLP